MATNIQMAKGPIKIASISGYSGDRFDALANVLSGPIEVDAVVGDYLAEMNLFWRKEEKNQEASKGFDPTFIKCLETASTQLGERIAAGTFPKLVVNAGGLNPQQLALELQQFLVSEFGDRGKSLRIAYVTGDDVLSIIQDPESRKAVSHLTTGETLDSWNFEPIIANAYIGQAGFVEALKAGADIVLAGRTTDAGSTQALATWWFGWGKDDYDNHAMGLLTGHMIECGNYVTGGNFCGFKSIHPYYSLAYPIAEIYNDGHCVVTKQPGQNGIVNVDTVRSQLVYEIQGRYYYNPDVIADLSSLSIFQEGPERVHVSGFKGLPPPQTLKVAIQAYGGYQAEILVYAMGLDIEEKAQSFEEQIRIDLQSSGMDHKPFRKLDVQILGSCAPDPKSSNAATAIIRVFAQAAEKERLTRFNFEYPVIQNLGTAFPGFTPNLEYPRTSQPRPYLEYFPALISRSKVELKVHWLDSENYITIPHSSLTSNPADVRQENYEPTDAVDLDSFGRTLRVPLGHQVIARSGDKGSNVNVGLFPQGDSQEEWDWLRSMLTTKKVLELLGDDAAKISRIERVEFPKMKCVHFVLFDFLEGGVTSTSRPDSLGKGVAEFLRARIVDYPAKFYRGLDKRI
ncbi:DUF1446-domain-containing protein [Melanomma pulvis-pyrius CBS 109.77]|uniref:DUF1446-domain-containing protein n=1 Tax=Melanomma pulvis-pyrius CBS 109.77 TaxID=1314802 RepID=A0A6A6XUC1_9PLEO|nr:DUF1446-domain-containing protein [Melanomma pulvis-pyrius CBS 109.77]